MTLNNNNNTKKKVVTIIGYGSLLSEKSARITFPILYNFRIGRIKNYRRVFSYSPSIFFQYGIANMSTKEIASLAVEKHEGCNGFIASIFDVPSEYVLDDNGLPSQAFQEREDEFNIVTVPYEEIQQSQNDDNCYNNTDMIMINTERSAVGYMCLKSTDEEYIQRWGKERFDNEYTKYGLNTIWNWDINSDILPCPVYLRHCYLAAKSIDDICLTSFLDETYLIDRIITIRQYIQNHPEILLIEPPSDLIERYGG